MIRFLCRLLLIALPFVVWYVWSHIDQKRGNPKRTAPRVWLAAIGLLLVAASLLVTGLIGTANDKNATYVPVETAPNGTLVPGPR